MPRTLNPTSPLSSPWAEFLDEVDRLLTSSVQLHCVGGFVLITFYGAPRRTGDLDYITVVPIEESQTLERIAGPDSKLARKYKLHARRVGVEQVPENYQERLVEMFPQRFSQLRLFALDPYDLLLSKLTRNTAKDREDVRFLAKALALDPHLLRERYQRELRPNLANQDRHDLTLQLWLDAYFQR